MLVVYIKNLVGTSTSIGAVFSIIIFSARLFYSTKKEYMSSIIYLYFVYINSQLQMFMKLIFIFIKKSVLWNYLYELDYLNQNTKYTKDKPWLVIFFNLDKSFTALLQSFFWRCNRNYNYIIKFIFWLITSFTHHIYGSFFEVLLRLMI